MLKLPKLLENLGTLLNSPTYAEWLSSEGKVIDKIIKRLTEKSTQEEREQKIEFTEDDLLPPAEIISSVSTAESVKNFLEDLEYFVHYQYVLENIDAKRL